MSIALSEFWTRLVRSGITDAPGCKLVAAAFSKAHGGTPPSDPAALARFMIKAGKLTDFQAEALLADPPREIRAGSFLIQSGPLDPPLSRWVRAKRTDDGRTGVLLRASAEQLGGGRMQWLEVHRELTAATLQPIEIEPMATSTLVFSPLPTGRSLHEVVGENGSLSPREACEIGIAVADAIALLHARSLLHGSIRVDRIWMGVDGQVILLRDPSGPPLTPHDDGSASWLDSLASPASYAAPEFANDGQVCNQATDIYSLGCLIFRLYSGRNPYDRDSFAETLATHATETLPELAEAVARGESGDPLYRVIAFAMAKSPGARFADAQQLAGALRATLPLLAKPPETVAATPDEGVSEANLRGPTAATPDSMPKPAPTVNKPASPAAPKPKQKTKSKQKPEVDSKSATKTASKSAAKAATKAAPASLPNSAPKQPKSSGRPPSKREPAASRAKKPPVASPSQPPAAASPQPPEPPQPEPPQPEPPPPEPPPPEPPQPEPPPPEPPPPEPPQRPSRALELARSSVPEKPPEPPAVPPAERPAPPAETSTTSLPAESGDEATAGRAIRRRKKRKTKAPLVLGAMCVAVLMLMIGLVVRDPNASVEEKKTRPPLPKVIPPVSNRRPQTPANDTLEKNPIVEGVAGYELVSDDRLLFIPPYAADTAEAPLELLPPGPPVIISVRLSAIMQSPLADALSPELDGLIKSVAARTKVSPASIARCTAAIHPGKEGWPEVSLAIELNEPQPVGALIEKWQVDQARTAEGATIYAGDGVDSDAYYFPNAEGESISRFALGSVARISEVAASEGGAIPLTRTFQSLWEESSEQADLVVLITPNFLFADGRQLLQSSVPELIRPLKSTLQPNVAAALLTAHVGGERAYIETRLAPSGGISEAALMRAIRESIQQWPGWADEFIVDSVPDASWRLLASRLPSMMRFVVDQTRFGISDGAVVANTYLPSQALPQVTLATLLAMNTPSGGGAGAVAVQPTKSLTIDEMLDRTMSVDFDQESLEFAIDAIAIAFKESLPAGSTMPPVRIIGSDLQLMGITQNQQVRDFTKSDLPLRTVLTELVLGANPDKSATGPKDAKQALIWVVADDPESPGNKVILVTTRQAAKGKYELPSEFQPAE